MARANRLRNDGGIFHLTHRCHNRAFLLKFACDRDAYRAKVWQHLKRFKIAILDYCFTSNHTHFVVDAEDQSEISGFMREVDGEFAKAYNRRKGRENAFWGDNYHATLVESGPHLWECMCYLELNMNRCGVVTHPKDWQWVGYQEIMGIRTRYRLIDLERLCWRLRTDSIEEVRRNLAVSLAERIARDQMKREPLWTESLAVGSIEFVQRIQPLIPVRYETEIVQPLQNIWTLQETPIAYGQKTGPKNACKALF